MGADLYLEPVHTEHRKKYEAAFTRAVLARDKLDRGDPKHKAAQERVSKAYDKMYSVGYFRDSYNSGNMLWRLGLSWWADIVPLVNKQGRLSKANIRRFLKMIEEREITVPRAPRNGDSEFSTEVWWTKVSEKERAEWLKFWGEQRRDLLKLLRQGLEKGVHIRASL